MKSIAFCLLLGLTSHLTFGAAFTPGDLVVVQVGDGVLGFSGTSMPVVLNEITRSGAPVQTIALPTVTIANSHALTLPVGTAGSSTEGYLHLSTDGHSLVMGGYDVPVGTSSPNSLNSGTAARVIAVVSPNGTIDTSTAMTTGTIGTVTTGTAFGGAIRSVTSDNGTRFWWSSSNSGGTLPLPNIGFTTLSSTTTVSITGSNSTTGTNGNGPGNTTSPRIFVNSGTSQLFASSNSGGNRIIIAGAGLSATTNGIIETFLPTQAGMALTSTPGDFFFGDTNNDGALDALWVAIDQGASLTSTFGGVARYNLSVSGTWNLQYTLNLGATINTSGTLFGVRGMTVDLSGTAPIIFGVTNEPIGNHVISIVDNGINTGTNSLVSILATAPSNTLFRGIDFAPTAIPEPTTLAALIAGSGLLMGLRRMRK